MQNKWTLSNSYVHTLDCRQWRKRNTQRKVILSRMSSWSKSLSFLLQVWDLLLSPKGKPGCHFVLVEKNCWHEEILFILFLVLQLQPQSKKRSGHRWEWNYFSHEIGLSPASLFEVIFEKNAHFPIEDLTNYCF